LVAERLRQMLTDSPALLDALRGAGLLPASAAAQHRLLQRARQLAEGWPTRTYAERRALLSSVLSRIDVGRDEVVLHLLPDKLLATLTDAAAAEAPGQQDTSVASAPLALTVPATLRRAGQEMRLVVGSTATPSQADAALVALIAKAHAVRDRLLRSEAESIAAFAAGEGVSKSYVIRLLRLAWLAPDIVAAILDGQQPAELTTTRLMRDTRLPLDWHSQRQALGFG
jgi:site-specific DNA recombinase